MVFSSTWIDLSINNTLKNGWATQYDKSFSGCVLKVGQGRESKDVYEENSNPFIDRQFESCYRDLAKAGCKNIACYWFFTATNHISIQLEAKACIGAVDKMVKETGIKPRFIAIDLEDFYNKPKFELSRASKDVKNKFKYMTSTYISALVVEFARLIEAAGYKYVLYSNLNFLLYVYCKNKSIMNMPLWFAYYSTDKKRFESICNKYKLNNVILWQCGTRVDNSISSRDIDNNIVVGGTLMDNKTKRKYINDKLKKLGRHELDDDTFKYLEKYEYGDDLMHAIYMLATGEKYII